MYIYVYIYVCIYTYICICIFIYIYIMYVEFPLHSAARLPGATAKTVIRYIFTYIDNINIMYIEYTLHSAARLPGARVKHMMGNPNPMASFATNRHRRLLLEANADPLATDQFGRTAAGLLEPELAAELFPEIGLTLG